MSDAFAELFEFNAAGSPIFCPTVGSFVQWESGGLGVAGPDDLIVADAGLDQLRVGAAGAGVYLVFLTMTFSADRPQVIVDGGVFRNGVVLPGIRFSTKLGDMKDVASAIAIGIVSLVAGDTLDARVTTDITNTNVEVIDGSLSALAYPRAIAA